MNYSNPGLYEYSDEYCDYFLVEDVVRCESKHPEYTGNVTLESLGLLQASTPEMANEAPIHAGLITISADEAIKHLGTTPIEMVDILNGYNVCDDYNNCIGTKRLVTVDEEAFREHANSGWNEKFFNMKSLGNVKIYQVDFDRYCEEWGVQKQTQAEAIDASGLESQLAETQTALNVKNTHIAELEKQLANAQRTAAELSASGVMLQEKDVLIAKLQSELGALRKLIGGYGALALVIEMLEAGSAKEDIATHLKKKGGLSYSQVGVLLHENPLNVGDSAIIMCAKRLLGIA